MDEEIKFRPLSDVLKEKVRNSGCEALLKAAEEIGTWPDSKLMNQLVMAFEEGSRTHSFLISEELTRRGIPPYLRSLALPLPEYQDCDVNRRFDLLAYDLRWVVATYTDHRTLAPRYMDIFKHGRFHKGLEHIAKRGDREIWEIVRDMDLSVDQQWDCHAIRGREVMNERRYIRERRMACLEYLDRSIEAAKSCGLSVERKSEIRRRRFNIWICSCIAGRDRPTEIARRYRQLTGEQISRQIVARQLEMIPAKIRPT